MQLQEVDEKMKLIKNKENEQDKPLEVQNTVDNFTPSGIGTSLILKSYETSSIQTKNHMENLSYSNHVFNGIEKKSQTPFMTAYQSLSCSLPEPLSLNKTLEYRTSLQGTSLVTKDDNELSSVRDMALASSSVHDIEYIDADTESHLPESPDGKTEVERFKGTDIISNILGLEDLLTTFTDSTSLHTNFQAIPAKSNLKRKISVQLCSKKNKVKKSGLKFTNITIFYFERSQGFSSIPSKGGSTLGMANLHFYITTIPIDEYEHKKIQKELPKLRTNRVIYHRRNDDREKPKNVQALTLSQRIELLECAEVQIELKEEDDCAYIRSSRASAGCDCKEYCDPEICDCSLSGIECQVDRPNFPCGCSQENCRNVMGCNEYNHTKVKTHFIKTMRKIKLENKGKPSKRKHATPTKFAVNNSDSNQI